MWVLLLHLHLRSRLALNPYCPYLADHASQLHVRTYT